MMRCPVCPSEDTAVVDSRPITNNTMIRRRRKCLDCGHRFSTHEACSVTGTAGPVTPEMFRRVLGRIQIDIDVLSAFLDGTESGRPDHG